MSQFTNFLENKLVDFIRGLGIDLPSDWRIGLLSEFDTDGSYTELAGVDYERQVIGRTLANFAGTQAPGSSTPSTGTSHATSNSVEIDLGTAGSDWGVAIAVGFFDESSDGELCMVCALPAPLTIENGDPVVIPAGVISFTLGLTGGLSDYASNKLIDLIFRGQAFSWPATTYIGYSTSTPTNSTPGAEPLGGYARVGVASEAEQWSATQGFGETDPSSGTSGETSNIEQILFPTATADQGAASHYMQFDSSTVGNMLFWSPLTVGGVPTPYTVNTGNQPRFEPGDLVIRID